MKIFLYLFLLTFSLPSPADNVKSAGGGGKEMSFEEFINMMKDNAQQQRKLYNEYIKNIKKIEEYRQNKRKLYHQNKQQKEQYAKEDSLWKTEYEKEYSMYKEQQSKSDSIRQIESKEMSNTQNGGNTCTNDEAKDMKENQEKKSSSSNILNKLAILIIGAIAGAFGFKSWEEKRRKKQNFIKDDTHSLKKTELERKQQEEIKRQQEQRVNKQFVQSDSKKMEQKVEFQDQMQGNGIQEKNERQQCEVEKSQQDKAEEKNRIAHEEENRKNRIIVKYANISVVGNKLIINSMALTENPAQKMFQVDMNDYKKTATYVINPNMGINDLNTLKKFVEFSDPTGPVKSYKTVEKGTMNLEGRNWIITTKLKINLIY